MENGAFTLYPAKENMEKWHDAGTKMQKSKMYSMISSLRQNI
jgi:hypothetical protein